jgi:glycosyltransferase involved in cell wall biosynthesis
MKILWVFAHPAPYKIDLFNILEKNVDLTVIFERHFDKQRDPKFYQNQPLNFKAIFLGGITLGNENHFSLGVISHLKKNHYDLIVMNGYASLTEIFTILYLQRKKIPYILYVNGGVIRKDPTWRFKLKKRLISKATRFFSPAAEVDDYLVYYGAPKKKILRYPYATIFEHELASKVMTNEEKATIREKLGLSKEPLFVSSGQFIDRKNYMVLLSAWTLAPKNYQLLLIGGGEEENKYRSFITQSGLDNIKLMKFQNKSDLLRIFRVSDGFIILSKEDIYGHVVNEALSQGLPVLSSDKVVSAKHLIKDGINGFVLPNLKPTTIISHANLLLKHDYFSDCLTTAKDNTLERMAQVHLALFQDLMP